MTATKKTDPPRAVLSSTRLRTARAPLDRATTLPAAAFTDPDVYAREVDRLFRREWLCAGRVEQIPNAGDYLCLDLLDEKLVVVRGEDDRIRALSRVCRHRAATVAEGAGHTRQFVCPYHAWTYGLDGRLLGAPLMDRLGDFDVERCRLPEIRSEVWEGFVFVNLDPDAEALGPRLAPLSKLLAPYAIGDRVASPTATYVSEFNWKILVDNFMEAYHHLATHRETLQPLLPAARSFVPDSVGPYSVLLMPAREAPEGEPIDPGEPPAALAAAVVYPFHLFAPTPHSMAWYQLLPERHDRFTLRIFTCFEPSTVEAGAEAMDALHAFTRTIHEEDIGACESVWAGLRSPGFEAGRLSTLEKAIWQFNQWWSDRMAVD